MAVLGIFRSHHARGEYLKIGATSGSGQRSFNASNPITYNFGITTAGGQNGLSAINLDVWVDRGQQNQNDITVTVYDAFGATGNVVRTAIIPRPASASSTVQVTGSFNPVVSLPAGQYSIQLTTAATGIGSNTYLYRQGPLQLTDVNGTPLSAYYWVQDLNTTGQSTTSFSAATGVLAQHTLSSQRVDFGNFRLGTTLSQSVQLSNSNIATSNNFSEALAATATTTNTATVAGLPTPASPLAQGGSANLTVGLGSSVAGPVSGDVNLSFSSEKGSSAAPGPFGTAIGSSSIAVTGTGYRPAVAGFSTTNADLGKFHIGASSLSGTVAVSNDASTADAYSEGLALTDAAQTGGASVAGLPTVVSPLAAGGSRNLTVGLASVSQVGTNSGTIMLGLDTSGTGTSGLAAESIGSQAITVTAQGYSGQSIWSKVSGGVWDSFDNWDVPGGLPGVDGSLSVNDTATFGAGPTGATVVSLDGANPVLTQIEFNSTDADYTLAPGSGGAFTLGTVQNAATLRVVAGSHAMTAAAGLSRATVVATANESRLSLSGVISGGASESLTKSGAGVLVLGGSNTYAGPTMVSEGTLLVNGNQSAATGNVDVLSGAILGGSGTIGGSTVVAAGGIYSPGTSPGILEQTSGLDYQGGSILVWELTANSVGNRGTTFDGIDVTGGALTIGLGVTSELVFDGSGGTSSVAWSDAFWSTDQRWLVFDNANVPVLASAEIFDTISVSDDSTGAALSTVRPLSTFSWQTDGNDVYLVYSVAVPEPAGLVSAAIGIVATGLVLRRHRRVCGVDAVRGP